MSSSIHLVLTSRLCLVNAARAVGAPAPLGDQSYDPAKAVHMLNFDNSKSITLLGLQYRSIQQTTSDIIEDMKARGWLKAELVLPV